MEGTSNHTHPDLHQKGRILERTFEQMRPKHETSPVRPEPGVLLDGCSDLIFNNVAHQSAKMQEQNQAGEGVRLQWQQFAALFDNLADSLYVADPQTYEILLVNKALEHAIGKDPVGGVCFEELHGFDAPCEFCTNEIILRSRAPYTWEYRNPISGGSYLVTDQIIKWPDGRDVRFEVAVDITARKKTEDALRKSERGLRRISRKLARAQETERKHLARELHDSIGGKLSGIKYGVEKVLKEMGDKQPSAGISLEDVVSMVKETIEDSRRFSARLRPPELDDLGLLRTIRSACRQFEKLYSGIRVETELNTEEEEIPEPLKIVIYRVLQEALTNVAKYSNAQAVRISLGKKDNGSELIIQDNGDGFRLEDLNGSAADGMNQKGLSNMRERTELSGGVFRIESEKGRGTTIRAFWPRLSMGNG
jgi:signal transduction histidine kinase